MTTALQVTLKDTGASAAVQVLAPVLNIGLGVPTSIAASTYETDGVYGGDSVSTTTSYCGFRRELAASVTLADRQYIQFRMAHGNLDRGSLSTWANGGIRVVFEDTLGNWAGFNVFGVDWSIFKDANDGYFSRFTGIGNNASQAIFWHIERARTPDYASASAINWAAVDAYEVHFRPASAGRMTLALGYLSTVDPSISTGAVSGVFADNAAAWQAGTGFERFPFKQPPQFFSGFANLVWASQIGLQIGNGATATTGTIEDFGVGFWCPPEDTFNGVYVGPGPFQLLSTPRLVDINQSATDSVTLNDGTISSSRFWGWRLRGSTTGVLAANRLTFVRAGQFECAHGTYTDCIWDGQTSPVEATTATIIVRGTIRNGTHGLKITGAAGTYSGTISLGGASTYDLQVGSGGAGTYNFPNITATTSLKIRNDSATNAVTVAIPSGIAYTTSTAGGTISVTTPPLYQSVTVTGMVAGSRLQIYDTTNSVELYNNLPAGTSYTWTDTAPAVGSRAIRVRIAHVSGATAYNFLEAAIGTCGIASNNAALSYLANQTLDTVYNTNAIDGSTVTGITIDDSTDRVSINIAGGSVSWRSIYAYQCYWNFTLAGIRDDGAIITAADPANYRVLGFKIKNTHATVPLKITNGYGVDSTGGVDLLYDITGGFIFPLPEHVVGYQTSGGVSSSDRALLQTAADNSTSVANGTAVVTANITRVRGQNLQGTGTTADPWNPT